MDGSQDVLVAQVNREATLFKDVGVAVGEAGSRWLETSDRLCEDLAALDGLSVLESSTSDEDHAGHVRAAAELFERIATLSRTVPQMLTGLATQASDFRDLLNECLEAVADGRMEQGAVDQAAQLRTSFERDYVAMADLLDEVVRADAALRYQLERLAPGAEQE